MHYACKLMFDLLQGVKATVFPYPATTPDNKTACLYYGKKPPKEQGVFFIESNGLLCSETIVPIEMKYGTIRKLPVLFTNEGAFGYDIFAAIFFMVSRYEEYLPFAPDSFGRFPEKTSTSGRNGFTNRPIVHEWAADFATQFSQFFPDYQVHHKKPTVLFTYDIDVAYAFKGRSFYTKLGALAKNLIKGQFRIVGQKILHGLGQTKDPSDTYDFILSGKLPKLFFFLWAAARSTYDRNIDPKGTALQRLAQQISKKYEAGIHPSYYSSEKTALIKDEKIALEQTLQRPITQSRQHFLKFILPDTYRALMEAGIQHDYSMQYPEMPGFRAGICVSYPFFDVANNEETALIIHPGCIMETTFRDDLHLSAAKSLDWYLNFWEQVKAVGGQYIAIWHNDTLWDNLPDDHPLAFRQIHTKLEQRIKKDLNN